MTTATEMTDWLKSINNDYSRNENQPNGEETRPVDTSITVGDKVRSFDFDYVDDCYFEGEVINIEDERYIIEISKKVFGGEDETERYIEMTGTTIIKAPVNGLLTWMESLTCGVQKI